MIVIADSKQEALELISADKNIYNHQTSIGSDIDINDIEEFNLDKGVKCELYGDR